MAVFDGSVTNMMEFVQQFKVHLVFAFATDNKQCPQKCTRVQNR